MTAKPVPEHISDERPKLTAYELQVLIGSTISGCNMSPDRTFDLPTAWARLKGLGLIDRADGIANATPAGVELVASTLTELQHRRESDEASRLREIIDNARQAFAETYDDDEARCRAMAAHLSEVDAILAASPSSPASGVRVIGYVTEEALKLMLTVKPKSGWHYHMFAKDQADAEATIAIYASDAEALSALGEHP